MNGLLVSLITQLCGLFLLLLAADAAHAQKRAALIIGNSSYLNVQKLDNPSNDAGAIADLFRQAKFDKVELKLDLGVVAFKRALRDFYNTTRDADVAVVYYAGHGIEVGGVNYMVPVDAKLASDYDAEDEAVALERIFRSIETVRRLRLVILDACRDNPFGRQMQRQIATRAVSQGLAKIEPMGTDTLVAYAAKAGSTAEDGSTGHSPFTQALLNNLTEPGLDIRIALGKVRDEVLKKTNNRQEPFVYGSLGGATVSLVPEAERRDTSVAEVRAAYEAAERVNTATAWKSFLAAHGTGLYAELAQQQLGKLTDQRMAALDPSGGQRQSKDRDRAGPDALAWEKVQDSSDPVEFRNFIKRYPSSPLTIEAQTRLGRLEQAAADRKREQAEREQAVREAQRQREEEEQRAKAAEAERQKAEREAQRQREAEERRAKAAEADRQRVEREAQRQRELEEKRAAAASEAERQRLEREAQRQREEEEKLARAAEAERQKAEREAQRQREEEERRAKAEAAEQQRLQREAALRLEKEKAEELVRSAQGELRRIGCYDGRDTGTVNDDTKRALAAYYANRGVKKGEEKITENLVTELRGQSAFADCLAALEQPKKDTIERPREKKPEPEAERPVREKRSKPEVVERPVRERREKPEVAPRREKPEVAAPRREPREQRQEARPAPRREAPRPQATASRPTGGGGRSGGGSVMHGIGF